MANNDKLMALLLHTLRLQTRRLAGVVVFVFTLGSLLTMLPAQAKDTMAVHDHSTQMPASMHHGGHAPAAPPSHHHGTSACCLGAMSCTQACDHSLMTLSALAAVAGGAVIPLNHDASVAVTRPIQPPRRPPKA
ncbi:MAG TPA: hypothetical protein VGE50_12155 [Gammaproteobacteria bacterium]